MPWVSKLMALAIRFDGLLRDGVVTDQAELARLGHVSRARVTQIMNLLHLAPDIQEELLFLPRIERGREPIQERHLRPIAASADWRKQRRMWRELRATGTKRGEPLGWQLGGKGKCQRKLSLSDKFHSESKSPRGAFALRYQHRRRKQFAHRRS